MPLLALHGQWVPLLVLHGQWVPLLALHGQPEVGEGSGGQRHELMGAVAWLRGTEAWAEGDRGLG